MGRLNNLSDPCHIEENLNAGQTLIRTLYDSGVKRFVLAGSSAEYGADPVLRTLDRDQ